MREIKYNDAWKYWPDKDSFALVWSVPPEAKDVTLPHDAMIVEPAFAESRNGGNTGFRDAEVYTYVKTIYAPEEYRNQTVALKFEGIYMNAFVYINGQLAAKNPFGYTTFYAPLNDFLKYGEDNEIRIQVRAGAMTNSRWYSGAGIYRDVYLLEGGLVHVEPESLQIKTEEADEDLAVLYISADINNREPNPKALMVYTEVKDAAGNVVAAERTRSTLLGQEVRKINLRLTVENPALWSAETPDLYTCEMKIYEVDADKDSAEPLDAAADTFGIRTLRVDAKRGLRVNGKVVNLRGGCIHHDTGLLGAACFEDAQYRQIKLMKEAGFNAIRMSHQPMAPAMLRACDAIGMYVMDESFDMWNRLKSDYDYGLFFKEWWEKDITAMVKKDFNHPSVVLYSIGNEIPEIGTTHGAKMCHDICEVVKKLDDTRFTMASINGVFASGDAIPEIMADVSADLAAKGEISGNVNDFMTMMDSNLDDIVVHRAIGERLERACASTDVAGYNYMTARYEPDGKAYPNRVIVGSETYPPMIARNWALVEKLPYVIGDFTWTGWDYIGEAGVGVPAYQWGEGGFGAGFPAQLAYPGDFDINGNRRPASYFRETVFGLRKDPYIVVQNPYHYGDMLIKTPWVISDAIPSWTYEGMEGKPVVVEVYAPGTEVELFKDGVSLGRKASGKEAGFRTLFETTYDPGTLTAVVYDGDAEISRSTLSTTGKAAQIVLCAEEAGEELVYIPAALTDADGAVVTGEDQKITLTVEGGAEAVGFGSGDPKPKYNFNEGVTTTFYGRALVILRKTEGGSVKVTVESESGLKGETTVEL